MTKHRNSNLLLFLFGVAVLIALFLLPDASLQAAPAFQSGIPTPTATSTLIPTPTPTAPPDIAQSSKTVSHSTAVLGDVLTYTITIVKSGPPVMVVASEFFEPALGNFAHISHTQPAHFSIGPDGLVWYTLTPPGLYTAEITYRAEVWAMPPDGILTNTILVIPFGGARATRQAVTVLQTPTPLPLPTFTPSPTATPVPTSTPSPAVTPLPPVSPKRTAGRPALTATPAFQPWQPPIDWPNVLPETGER